MSEGKTAPEKMALKADPKPITRLSKKAIMGGGCLFVMVMASATLVTFSSSEANHEPAPAELYNISHKPIAEVVRAAPSNYGEMRPSMLGVPEGKSEAELGVVLGSPFRNASERLAVIRQRKTDERSATANYTSRAQPNTSELFFQRSSARAAALSGDQFQPFQGKNAETNLAGTHQLVAGTLIPASLVTGIHSDLPGTAIAQVTQAVYDSATGDHILIPQGARLIGAYESKIDSGQSRVFITWSRIINPDGRSFSLDNLSASDLSGYSGLKDRVDNHTGKLLKAGLLSTMLGVGAELGRPNREDAIAASIRDGIQGTANTAGQKIIERQLLAQPTLTIRPGWSFHIIVTTDLHLPVYET